MTGWRRPGMIAALLLVAALVLFLWPRGPGPIAPREPGAQPTLMLMTSLPIMFGESFGLEGNGSAALTALEKRYRVVPIGVADAASLKHGKLLLMAHASAQPAEALVDLDAWVRSGGRLMLLADPALEWPSERPLGDKLRPAPMFMDTGLLAHWGLKLEAPAERGPVMQTLAGMEIETASPGRLSGDCTIGKDALVARCTIGKGQVTVIADADFLDVEHLDGPTDRNLDALVAELASLESS